MHSGRLKVLIPAGVEHQFNVENNARALDQCWNDLECLLGIIPLLFEVIGMLKTYPTDIFSNFFFSFLFN
jgi:hypothetical protein